MKGKKSVLLYCDIIHTVEGLSNEEAGRLFKHYLRYINDQDPKPEDRLTALLFEPIKQNLKRDLKKWKHKSEQSKRAADARWAKQNDADASERIRTNAKYADKDIVTVKDNVKVKDIIERKAEFKNSLLPFQEKLNGEFDNFYEYWSEHGSKDKKMRFEKETSFSISRRVSTWLKNQKKWEKENPTKERFSLSMEDLTLNDQNKLT